MFGIVSSLLSTATAVIFPAIASYKALKANDITLLRPWLMYWVVLGIGATAESYLSPVLRLVPLYGTARFAGLLWLVLPSSQGAVTVYNEHLAPWMEEHEGAIDDILTSTYNQIRQFGLDKFAQLTGPSEPAREPEPVPSGSISETLFGKFRLPVPVGYDLNALISSWTAPRSQEEISQQRTQLMALLSSLDRLRNETDHDGYDVVDTPSNRATGPSTPTKGNTTGARKGWLW